MILLTKSQEHYNNTLIIMRLAVDGFDRGRRGVDGDVFYGTSPPRSAH